MFSNLVFIELLILSFNLVLARKCDLMASMNQVSNASVIAGYLLIFLLLLAIVFTVFPLFAWSLLAIPPLIPLGIFFYPVIRSFQPHAGTINILMSSFCCQTILCCLTWLAVFVPGQSLEIAKMVFGVESRMDCSPMIALLVLGLVPVSTAWMTSEILFNKRGFFKLWLSYLIMLLILTLLKHA